MNRDPDATSARLSVRLVPRGGADRIDGVVGGVLHVRVASPPVDGQANAALTRLIARELEIPPSSVRLVRGSSGRTKVLELTGVERSALVARWPDLGV